MKWRWKAVAAAVAACSLFTLSGTAAADHDPYLMQHSSTGPAGGNGPVDPIDHYASRDGTRLWFRTTEPLVAEDSDTLLDLYERSAAVSVSCPPVRRMTAPQPPGPFWVMRPPTGRTCTSSLWTG